MPLPSDQKLVTLSEEIIALFDQMFELHPGFRPSHARGVMLTGSFTPTPDAAALSAAPHFHQASTPVTARFSSSTGLPLIPDNDPNANPRGFALRFNLAEHKHTDIIGISTPKFPAHDGRGFLEFMRASAGGSVADFLVSHPAAKTFVETPKPFSTSFAHEAYYALHAFKFTSRTGETRYGRYSIVPSAGAQYLDEVTAKAKGESYLFDELQARIARGPISFEIVLQVAQDGDNVDDTTVTWPADRQKIVLGIFSLDTLVPDNAVAQKQIIFDPIPRIQGIDESDDPLFEFRAASAS